MNIKKWEEEFDYKFREKIVHDATKILMSLGDLERLDAMGYAVKEKNQIKEFIHQIINTIEKDLVGDEDICKEKLFIHEKEIGREYPNGGKFWSNGYNKKRQEIIEYFKNIK